MKRDNKLYIHEDVTDWQEKILQAELIIADEDAIFEAIDDGVSTRDIAMGVVVSQLRGDAPPDLIPPVKLLVLDGGQAAIIRKAHTKRVTVQTKSGEYKANQYVGKVLDKSDSENEHVSYVNNGSPEALDRAINYLANVVPGHIWMRLLEVHNSGGDVKAAADELIDRIIAMVEKIV